MVAPISDHTPLLLQLNPLPWRQPLRSFKFNNEWVLEPDFIELLKTNWAHYPPTNITTKLQYCIDDMAAWSRNASPNFRRLINKQRSQIEDFRATVDGATDPQLLNMHQNLANLLLQEESYWRQRSKVFWLSDGDSNSKFFHALASAYRQRNTRKKLHNDSGNWLTAHDDLCSLVRNYFTTIFAEKQGVTPTSSHVFRIKFQMMITILSHNHSQNKNFMKQYLICILINPPDRMV